MTRTTSSPSPCTSTSNGRSPGWRCCPPLAPPAGPTTPWRMSWSPWTWSLSKTCGCRKSLSINLKTYKVIDVLSKLAGLWIDTDKNVLYSQAPHITFICPMRFDKFPFHTQTCKFRVGSYSYDTSKLLFITKNAGERKTLLCMKIWHLDFRVLIWGDQQYCAWLWYMWVVLMLEEPYSNFLVFHQIVYSLCSCNNFLLFMCLQ